MKKAQEQKATQPLKKPKNPKQPTLLDLVGLLREKKKKKTGMKSLLLESNKDDF